MNLYAVAVSKKLVVGFRFCSLALVSLGLISSVGCRGSAPRESATSDAESPSEAGAPSAEEPTGETYPRAQEPATAPPVATTPALEAPSAVTPTPSQAPAPSPKSHAHVSAPEPVPTEPPRAEPPPPPEIVDVEVASGTILELELLTPLDSSVNRINDELQARTLSPLYVRGEQVLPSGSYVEGRVTEVQASGRVKGRARLAFTFDRLSTPTGLKKIRTSYVEREAESDTKKDAIVIGGGVGLGALVGGIIGGKKGAAIGATIGGAGGTGVVLSTKGEEIKLPVGTEMNVQLDEPVVIQVTTAPK